MATFHTKPLLGAMPNPAHPLMRGIAGWWLFNEGGGSRINDISGNNRRGVLTGVAQSSTSGWSGGHSGSSVLFDGTDDYVTSIGSVADFSFVQNTLIFSISGWIQISNLANRNFILGPTGASAEKGFLFGWDTFSSAVGDHALRFVGFLGTGGVFVVDAHSNNNATILDNNWHHVAVVSTAAAANKITFYVDGVAKTTTYNAAFNAVSSGDSTRLLTLGALNSATPPLLPFGGSIDDIRIWNRALSQNEIWQLYSDPYVMFNRNPYRWFAASGAKTRSHAYVMG